MVVEVVLVGAVDSPDSISTNEILMPSKQHGDGAAERLVCSVGETKGRTATVKVELSH